MEDLPPLLRVQVGEPQVRLGGAYGRKKPAADVRDQPPGKTDDSGRGIGAETMRG
jgi:hypothetical protein